MPDKFLTAEWRKLIFANYPVDPGILQPFVPYKTELDVFNSIHYVSLVGFMFCNTRVMGLRVPFHSNFPEVNLRFYVRMKSNGEWKRGVVFIKEIVPKPAVSFVANTFFNERYTTMPMHSYTEQYPETQKLGYQWKHRGKWNHIEVKAAIPSKEIEPGSEEEFITQHFWGYNAVNPNQTTEYEVSHPKWVQYPVEEYKIDGDFTGIYGSAFSSLSNTQPLSVILAEGSEIAVFNKKVIR
jgi:uncharacterized protein YqjF (DUF2071 family)